LKDYYFNRDLKIIAIIFITGGINSMTAFYAIFYPNQRSDSPITKTTMF
jgi:hypothetical protein